MAGEGEEVERRLAITSSRASKRPDAPLENRDKPKRFDKVSQFDYTKANSVWMWGLDRSGLGDLTGLDPNANRQLKCNTL